MKVHGAFGQEVLGLGFRVSRGFGVSGRGDQVTSIYLLRLRSRALLSVIESRSKNPKPETLKA